MKIRILLGVLAVVAPFGINAGAQTYQSHIAHPIVRYRMFARYDPATKRIAGHYNLIWWNHTADSIPDLYFHSISMLSRIWIARSFRKIPSAGGAIS